MDQLVAGKLDMAFIAHIISPFSKASNIDAYQLDHYRLYTLVVDNYHAIVSRRHRFAGLDVVTWQDLADYAAKLKASGMKCGYASGWQGWIQLENFVVPPSFSSST